MTSITRLYGLAIRSELPLHQDRVLPDGTSVDLDIVLGTTASRTEDAPPGRVLLHLEADRQYYTATQVDDGYLLRFYSTCDVRITPELDVATVHLFEGADPDIAAVLAGGTVLAFVLAMRGDAVLHASAVQVGSSALAFVGASGMGKSTLATLLCADGASLITDDLLRLNPSATLPTCSLGATELRLRKAASELSDQFDAAPGRRTTGDARDALQVPHSDTEDLPLVAIVIPAPDHSAERTESSIKRLDAMAAFLLLSQFPRLLGWEDEATLRRQFQQLGDLIDRVPVYLARLPWGPPFPEGVPSEIRRAVGLAAPSS